MACELQHFNFQSWISQEMDELYDRYLGPRWREEPAEESVWARASRISAEELWRTHERRRERLVAFARRRLREQLERRGAPQSEVEAVDETLDPDALTIGFGRRFATYKRANLLEANSVACCRSGLHGFTVRALPRHPDSIAPFLPGLIVWAQADESLR